MAGEEGRATEQDMGATGRGWPVVLVPARPWTKAITHRGGRMPASTGAARGSPASAPSLGLRPETPGIRKSARHVCETLSDTPWQ